MEVHWKIPTTSAINYERVESNRIHRFFGETPSIQLLSGNENWGLTHIWSRHETEYITTPGLGANTSQKVSEFLHSFLRDGQYKTYGYSIRTSEDGRETLAIGYELDEKYGLKVAISNDGRIITAVPTAKSQMKKYDY